MLFESLNSLENYKRHLESSKFSSKRDANKKPTNRDLSDVLKFKTDKTLFPYQNVGVRWLIDCFWDRRNCVLADEMGLGKTIQVIGLFQYLLQFCSICGPFLIVAPMGVMEQWKKEIEEWTQLYCVVFYGKSKARDIIYEHDWFFPEDFSKPENNDMAEQPKHRLVKFDVLITSFETAMIEIDRLCNIEWFYFVMDEAHRIKNNDSKLSKILSRIKCCHKLLLTGTPLQNDLKELWNLIHFIEPNRFKSRDEFLNEYGDLKEENQVEKLHKQLGPYLLRRTKTNVAEIKMPKKSEILIEIELTMIQKYYYRAILERNKGI